jgi:AraC-like DNA-binding protein
LLYYSSAVVDSATRKVYVLAADDSLRRYVLCADYGQTDSCGRAVLSMGFTPPLPDLGYAHPLLTPQGNLLMTGGILTSNYAPQATVYIFYVGNPGEVVSRTSLLSRRFMGLSVGLGLLIIALAAASLAGYCRYRKQSLPTQETAPPAPKPETEDGGPETLRSASMPLPGNLMPRIREMMAREQLFLNSERKVSDGATRLGVNNRSVSDCINSAAGWSFSEFVNAYRIDYAKQLMTSQPDMKMAALYMEVGFSNETSFFRTFKSLTGMTPTEWRQKKE